MPKTLTATHTLQSTKNLKISFLYLWKSNQGTSVYETHFRHGNVNTLVLVSRTCECLPAVA